MTPNAMVAAMVDHDTEPTLEGIAAACDEIIVVLADITALIAPIRPYLDGSLSITEALPPQLRAMLSQFGI